MALAPMLALALASCGGGGPVPGAPPHAHSAHGHEHDEGPVLFEAGKGVSLSKESLASMGVTTAEVTERPVAGVISATAQVYRGADEPSTDSGRYRTGHAYATAAIPPAAAAGVKPGRPVVLTGPGNPVEEKGRLVRLDDGLRPAHGTIEALIEIPDEKNARPIGTFVPVRFETTDPRTVTAIPSAALLTASDGLFVYVQNGPHLLRTPVKIGVSDGEWIEITDGLLPGDVVATTAVEALWTVELRAVKGGGHSH